MRMDGSKGKSVSEKFKKWNGEKLLPHWEIPSVGPPFIPLILIQEKTLNSGIFNRTVFDGFGIGRNIFQKWEFTQA